MERQQLINLVYNYCLNDPSLVPAVIDAATQGVKDFAKDQRDKVSHIEELQNRYGKSAECAYCGLIKPIKYVINNNNFCSHPCIDSYRAILPPRHRD